MKEYIYLIHMISTFESKIVPRTNMGFAQVWGASSIEVDPRLVPGTNLGYILHRFYTRLVPGTSLGYSPHRVDTRLEFGCVLLKSIPNLFRE